MDFSFYGIKLAIFCAFSLTKKAMQSRGVTLIQFFGHTKRTP